MISLYDVVAARRHMAQFGFLDPGFLSSALYTLEEANEVLSLIHLELRPTDLRARGKDARDKMDKELAQTVFMAFSCLAHCGSALVTVEYDRREPGYSDLILALQMVTDALEAVKAATVSDTRQASVHATEVVAWAYLLAERYGSNLDAAMWNWLAAIEDKVLEERESAA